MAKKKITITEALAEIRTIEKRIQKKRDFVKEHLLREATLKDPLDEQGGSVTMLKRERQGIADLEERLIALRKAIREANDKNEITINGTSRTISDWLVWQREIAHSHGGFLNNMAGQISQARHQWMRQGRIVVGAEAAQKPTDILVSLDEAKLQEELEKHEETLGSLDGLLSLKNATITWP